MEDENVATTCRESENDVVDEAEDYDDDDEGSAELESDVQLGFVEKDDRNVLFRDPDWRNWDGGTVGGRPVIYVCAQLPCLINAVYTVSYCADLAEPGRDS